MRAIRTKAIEIPSDISRELTRPNWGLIPSRIRRAICLVFGCLGDPDRRNPDWLDHRFESLLEQLNLPTAERDEVRSIVRQNPDPLPVEVFDAKIGVLILSILMMCALCEDGYDARDRIALRQIANKIGVDWSQVTNMEERLANELRKIPMREQPPSRRALRTAIFRSCSRL
jgi:hypothetical protein